MNMMKGMWVSVWCFGAGEKIRGSRISLLFMTCVRVDTWNHHISMTAENGISQY